MEIRFFSPATNSDMTFPSISMISLRFSMLLYYVVIGKCTTVLRICDRLRQMRSPMFVYLGFRRESKDTTGTSDEWSDVHPSSFHSNSPISQFVSEPSTCIDNDSK